MPGLSLALPLGIALHPLLALRQSSCLIRLSAPPIAPAIKPGALQAPVTPTPPFRSLATGAKAKVETSTGSAPTSAVLPDFITMASSQIASATQGVWLTSFLLRREVELQELYQLSTPDLDLIRAETAILLKDSETRRHKALIAGYFLELAQIIATRREGEGV